ncbi:hypothetical protein NL526_29725, partial [Klebsiella pneumoniae]|nr:hypothetical protein [Klebsiella pneumoniae]
AGSRLVLEGFANKPLSLAYLTIGEARVPLLLAENKFEGELLAEQLTSGTYGIHLADRVSPQPLTSKRPASFGLRVLPDRT